MNESDEMTTIHVSCPHCGLSFPSEKRARRVGLSDRTMDDVFDELGEEILEINVANGWNVTTPSSWDDTYKIPAVLALIHSEVSEALEAFRKGDRDNFEEECADKIIRILDMTAGLGISIGPVIRAKLAKNRTRGYRHGGKRV